MPRCVFVEGSRCKKQSLERCSSAGLCGCWCEGASWEEVRRAVDLLSGAVVEYGRWWKRWVKRELDLSLRLDTPPPVVRGDVVTTGFWVGVANLKIDGRDFHMEIVPRVKCYASMLERAALVFKPVRRLYLLSRAVSVDTFNLAAAQRLAALAHELYWALLRGPRRTLVALPDGQVLTRLNEPLLSAVAASLRAAVELLHRLKSARPESPAVADVVDFFVRPAEAALRGVWSPELADALFLDRVEDFGDYWHLPSMARGLGRRGLSPAVEATGVASFALVPSTKVYELYLMALVVEALAQLQGLDADAVVDVGGSSVKVGRYWVYFNDAPASAVVRSVAGRKPKPDVVVDGGDVRFVLDAKYRPADRIELKDALRFVAYLVDVATDHKLHGVVAALTRREPVEADVATSGGRVKIRIEFVKVDPCDHGSSLEEVRRVLEKLIQAAG